MRIRGTMLLALAAAACSAVPPAATTVPPAGGAGIPASSAGRLAGGEWHVERVEDRPLVERSFITMRFGEDGQVLGRAACNGWSAGYRVTGRAIAFTAGMATLRACVPAALGEQEGRFHRVLSAVRRFEITPDGTLVLSTQDGRSIRARRG